MGEIINNFGSNAGKVWNALNEKGPLNQNKLMKTTKLSKYDIFSAVGWLAREDKICLKNNDYCLGVTNFAENIGEDAGTIFDLLNTFDEIDLNFIQKLTGITPENTYYALGWLAREGKISAKKVLPKKPQIYLKLK
jgi:hypothetical protein